MSYRLRRRKFGQLAIATAAATALANLANKTLAQTAEEEPLLYGVRAVPGGQGLLLQSLNLTTDEVKDETARTLGLTLEPEERVSSFTVLDDDTFALATAPTTHVITGNPVTPSRPNFLPTASQSLPASALRSVSVLQSLPALQAVDEKVTIESWLDNKDGKLFSIVSLNQGLLPFRLAVIDRNTAEVNFIDDLDLPPNRPFSHLTQSPNGAIYATTIGTEGYTSLVRLERQNKSIITGKGQIVSLVRLKFNNRHLPNDVASLAWSPSNQLYALGDPTYTGTNSLFTVNVNTGVLTLLRTFDVDKIVFARS